MSDLDRFCDTEGSLGSAFRSAKNDAPREGSTAALLTALSLGAASASTAAVGAGVGTATASAAGKTAAGTALAKATTLASAWKLMALSVVLVSGVAASAHFVSRDVSPPAEVARVGTTEPLVSGPSHIALPPSGREAEKSPAEAVAVVASAPKNASALPASKTAEMARAETEKPNEGSAAKPRAPVDPLAPSPQAALAASSPQDKTAASNPRENAGVLPSEPVPAPKGSPNETADEKGTKSAALAAPAPATPRSATSESSTPRPKSAGGAGRVAEEVAALDRARGHLSAGRASQAVTSIEAYERAFPDPVLAEEALALKVEALVRAGRSREAVTIGDAFLSRRPQSPVAARIRRSLASAR